jgi:S1-C subfamily serine protease
MTPRHPTATSRRGCLQLLAALTTAAVAPLAGALVAAPARAALPDTVARLRRSVLPVGTYSATQSPRFGFRGSGFVVGDGTLVATNAHVVPEAADVEGLLQLAVLEREATEETANGTPGASGAASAGVRPARLLTIDRAHDLALLKLDGTPLPALTLAQGAAREGQAIALMGFPIGGTFGFSPVTHRGIVASLTQLALPAATAQQLDPRAITRLRAGNFEVLQLDATAYPGNSGGPVFDPDTGEVLGVLNMVLVRGSRESALSQPTGISYAIPVRHLAALLQGR